MARRTSVPPALPATTSGTRPRAAATGDRGVNSLAVRGREPGGGEVRAGAELGGGRRSNGTDRDGGGRPHQTARKLACTAISRGATSIRRSYDCRECQMGMLLMVALESP